MFVAFIIDVFSRMVVGSQASGSLRADLTIDALEMAVTTRGRADDLDQLVHHGIHIFACAAANASLTTTSSHQSYSYDNAMAESFNGLYKWELISAHDDLERSRRRRVRNP